MTQADENLHVTIKNCNSIGYAKIGLVKGGLNIKYGPNGLGKSTIAKAIVAEIKKDGTLENLISFKNRVKSAAEKPSVSGVEGLSSALVFDEEYVNQFVFQQDEIIKNSFDIFIKTKKYQDSMTEIGKLFEGIKKAFSSNVEIEQTIKDLKELRDAFGTPNKDGSLAKSCKVIKAFGSGNKIENVPESLKPFEKFIRSSDPSKWIGWQIKGNQFLELSDTCPYCSTALPPGPQKETALAVAKEYDEKSVSYLNTLKSIIERLGKYFSQECQKNLENITKAKIELTAEEKNFLIGLKREIDELIDKIEKLRTISFFALRDVDKIEEQIKLLNIDLSMIDKLDSEETRKVVDPINTQLKELQGKIGILKGSINKHKKGIAKTIKDNEESINNFLKLAGYKYSVAIISESDSYKMKLTHADMSQHIESASNHLSYGEKMPFHWFFLCTKFYQKTQILLCLTTLFHHSIKIRNLPSCMSYLMGKQALKVEQPSC